MTLANWIDQVLLPRVTPEILFPGIEFAKMGGQLRTRCPLHDGSNPTSFSVDPKRWLFHCFSCGVSGNAFTYLGMAEGLTFLEALRCLCNRCGLQLPRKDGEDGGGTSKHACLERIATVFQQVIQSPGPAEAARGIEEARGLPAGALRTFGLGWHPGPDRLRACLMEERPAAVAVAEAHGLFRASWTNRLVGAWRDGNRSVRTFWGRAARSDRLPKYLYAKGASQSGLPPWGMERLRFSRAKQDPLLVVEGFLDAVHLWSVGWPCAVALGGTGARAGEDFWNALHRAGWHRVVLALDQDEAGKVGTREALRNLLASGHRLDVAVLDGRGWGGAKDLDEWLGGSRDRRDLENLLTGPDCLPDTCFLAEDALRNWGDGGVHDLESVDRALTVLGRYQRLAGAIEVVEALRRIQARTGYGKGLLLRRVEELVQDGRAASLPAEILEAAFSATASAPDSEPAPGPPVDECIHDLFRAHPVAFTVLGAALHLTGASLSPLQGPDTELHRGALAGIDRDDLCNRIRMIVSEDLLRDPRSGNGSEGADSGDAESVGIRDQPVPDHVRRVRLERPRAYSRWTEEEDLQLRAEVEEGIPIEEIARRHERKGSAIRSRILRLNYQEVAHRTEGVIEASRLSEVRRQIKEARPGHLVFLESGFFLNLFGEDAEWCAQHLGWGTYEWNGVTATGVPAAGATVFRELERRRRPYLIALRPEGEPPTNPLRRMIAKEWPLDCSIRQQPEATEVERDPEADHPSAQEVPVETQKLCQGCGHAIPPRRLEAIPDARFCVQCQEKEEEPAQDDGDLGLCPRCLAPLVWRESRTYRAGQLFLGCSGFPACRFKKTGRAALN